MEDFTSKGTAGRLGPRPGPVHARDARSIVTTVRVLFPVDDNTGMEERRANGP